MNRADPPVPQKLLDVTTDWASHRKKTYSDWDHPSVIMLELGFQIEAYWGPAFVAGYLRNLADKFDQRQKIFEAQRNG